MMAILLLCLIYIASFFCAKRGIKWLYENEWTNISPNLSDLLWVTIPGVNTIFILAFFVIIAKKAGRDTTKFFKINRVKK